MSRESVFPEDIDDFGLRKTNTLRGEMVDIEDYQYFMSKLPRLHSEQKRLERLQKLLQNRILMAGDISHYRSAIINIETYIKQLEEEINNRLDNLKDTIELIYYNIENIKESITNIKTIINNWSSSGISTVNTSCNNGYSIFQNVTEQTLFLRRIRGEGRVDVTDDGDCIHVSVSPKPLELVVQHVGGGNGTTEVVGLNNPVTGTSSQYTVVINEGQTINVKASINQEGYSFSYWYSSTGQYYYDAEITISNVSSSFVLQAYFEENAISAGDPISKIGGNQAFYTQMEMGSEAGWVVLEYHNGGGYSDRIEVIYPAISSNQLNTNYNDRIIAKTGQTNIWIRGRDGGSHPSPTETWNFPSIPSTGKTLEWNDEDGNPQSEQNGFVVRQGKLCFYHDPKDGNTRIGIRVKPTVRAETGWAIFVHPPNEKSLAYGYDLRAGTSRWSQYILDRPWAWANDPIVE